MNGEITDATNNIGRNGTTSTSTIHPDSLKETHSTWPHITAAITNPVPDLSKPNPQLERFHVAADAYLHGNEAKFSNFRVFTEGPNHSEQTPHLILRQDISSKKAKEDYHWAFSGIDPKDHLGGPGPMVSILVGASPGSSSISEDATKKSEASSVYGSASAGTTSFRSVSNASAFSESLSVKTQKSTAESSTPPSTDPEHLEKLARLKEKHQAFQLKKGLVAGGATHSSALGSERSSNRSSSTISTTSSALPQQTSWRQKGLSSSSEFDSSVEIIPKKGKLKQAQENLKAMFKRPVQALKQLKPVNMRNVRWVTSRKQGTTGLVDNREDDVSLYSDAEDRASENFQAAREWGRGKFKPGKYERTLELLKQSGMGLMQVGLGGTLGFALGKLLALLLKNRNPDVTHITVAEDLQEETLISSEKSTDYAVDLNNHQDLSDLNWLDAETRTALEDVFDALNPDLREASITDLKETLQALEPDERAEFTEKFAQTLAEGYEMGIHDPNTSVVGGDGSLGVRRDDFDTLWKNSVDEGHQAIHDPIQDGEHPPSGFAVNITRASENEGSTLTANLPVIGTFIGSSLAIANLWIQAKRRERFSPLNSPSFSDGWNPAPPKARNLSERSSSFEGLVT